MTENAPPPDSDQARVPPVRVLHLITDLAIGGAERMLTRLTTSGHSDRVRHHVVSMLPTEAFFADQIAASGVAVESLDMARGTIAPAAILRLVRIIRRVRPDVLQTWLYHADLLGTMAGKIARVPSIVWNIRCSDMDFRCYPASSGWVVRILRHLSGYPAAVIANSHAGRTAHERLGYRPRRWEIIPNGFDLPPLRDVRDAGRRVRDSLGLSRDVPLIGLVARYDPMKDHATFLHAAARLAARWPEVVFILAGRGVTRDNAELVRAIAAGGLNGRTHLLGERQDSTAVLAALDIATSCSAFGEGCPNVIGEAMACAVPCVSTTVGDASLLIGETGLCVPPRNPDALAAAWGSLLRLPGDGRTRMGAAGRQRVATQFALPLAIARYISLYESLAGHGPRSQGGDGNAGEMTASESTS